MNVCQTFYWKIILEEARLITPFFLKSKGEHLLIIQVYVDSIIFCVTHNDLCNEFSKNDEDQV